MDLMEEDEEKEKHSNKNSSSKRSSALTSTTKTSYSLKRPSSVSSNHAYETAVSNNKPVVDDAADLEV